IAENELANQIELARREEQLIAQRGQNEKKRITDESASKRIEAEASAGNIKVNAEAQADSIRMLEEARVRAERERMDIYKALQPARCFLESRGQRLDAVLERHELQRAALHLVNAATPSKWRRARVLRQELDRFLFDPEDVVIAVGQDGLVANVAKYLRGQPVI